MDAGRSQRACRLREHFASALQGGRARLTPCRRRPKYGWLGGLALDHDGESHALGGPKAQLLLSVLVAHRNQRLSIDRLVEAVWHDEPPKSATATIQSQISRLRSVLTPGFTITLESAGYQLETLDGEIDAARFESLLAKSRASSTAEAIVSLDTALALWHGPAFGQYAGHN